MQNDAVDAFLATALADLAAGNHDVSTVIAFVNWLNTNDLAIYRTFDFHPTTRMNGTRVALQFAGIDVTPLSDAELAAVVDLLAEERPDVLR
ncbi:MAG: hypothetical protein PHR28_04900 [candidate division Zixibacteria bacterium]|jgi:hypothetical protein|nr:hypothetical protein [candidate division Zixibacteria bacterium]